MPTIARRLAIVLTLALTVAGCVTDPQVQASSSVSLGSSPYIGEDLGTLTYRAVDLMLAGAPEVGSATPLVVASIANIQKLEGSSAFGNIVSEMIRTRLSQTGHMASEMRLRNSVALKKEGTASFSFPVTSMR